MSCVSAGAMRFSAVSDAPGPAIIESANVALDDYFRCADPLTRIVASKRLSPTSGFFQLGPEVVGYGRCTGAEPARVFDERIPDLLNRVEVSRDALELPFDLGAVVENLQYERYVAHPSRWYRHVAGQVVRSVYYGLRPILVRPVRSYLQRARLRDWRRLAFPRWPIDTAVDTLMRRVLSLVLRASGQDRIPFIWFWPDGAEACAVMTHDVETAAGVNFCRDLMDIDDQFGVKSSFGVIPERRYGVPRRLLRQLRARGFEVDIHDLNHDGRLFSSKPVFLRRAVRINRYARMFGTSGFRSGALYRNQDWYGALDVSYDMSVPNVAHLDPQRGGCCSVLPYPVGRVLELPVTTVQDYTLFHVLRDYSIEIWKQQIDILRRRNGLMTFITHPDYLIERRARRVYEDLLQHLARTCREQRVWIAQPRQVDAWWRSRGAMRLVRTRQSWGVSGPHSDRARVAYASIAGNRLVYTIDTPGQERR